MNGGVWVFDRVADGLRIGPTPPMRRLSKMHLCDTLLDVEGKPLVGSSATTAATTWRSHHAFSGRCGHVVETPPTHLTNLKTTGCNGGDEVSQSNTVLRSGEACISRVAENYRSWVLDFYLLSTSNNPHVLLSVAPHYLPPGVKTADGSGPGKKGSSVSTEDHNMYDKRMLETPLIWEEPMTLSVDCSATGMYLWSEEWGLFGEKVAETCFVRRGQTQDGNDLVDVNDSALQKGPYEALLRLSWRDTSMRENEISGGRQLSSHDEFRPPAGSVVSDSNGGFSHGEVSVFVSTSSVADVENGSTLHVAPGSVRALETAGTDGNERPKRISHVWQRVCQRLLPRNATSADLYFTPYVTLLDGGDEVTLL